MITLNADKGLIRVESWDDIQARPGFVCDLDPAQHALESIIGRYVFKAKIRCGLSNCHTPHAKGYIVVTRNGRETNIGKDCGKAYFGVDFETLSRRFDRDITEKENREQLWSFSFQLEELKNRISEMRGTQNGADWVYKNTRALLSPNRGCPEEVVRRISAMIKARQNLLSTQREATLQEIENLEARQGRRLPRPYYLDEPVAEIAGVDALYPENDLRSLLILDVEEKIKSFEEKDIDSLDYEALRYWVKWVGSIEKTIDHASDVVSYGRRLLQPQNLQPFLKVLTAQEDVSMLRAYIRGLSASL